MTQRGRKSAAALAIAAPSTVVPVARPDAPYDLNDEESAEWWAVVERLPADWFPRETHALLALYCRHVVNARRIAELIATALKKPTEFSVSDYDQLLKMQERESRAVSSLATRMRITQQATYDKSKKKPQGGKKLWED